MESACLDKALEEATTDRDDKYKVARTMSHFVEMNSNNEDSLLDGIDDEKSLKGMILDQESIVAG